MKKILVNVDEQYLELIRDLLQKRMGTKQSNSDVVNHVFFDYLLKHQVIKLEDFFVKT